MSPQNDPTASNESSKAAGTDVLDALLVELRNDRNDERTAALRRALGIDEPGAEVDESEPTIGTEIADLQAELEATEEDIDVLRTDVEDLKTTDDSLRNRLETRVQPRLDGFSRRLEDLDSQLGARDAETSGLRTEFNAVRDSLERTTADLEGDVDAHDERLADLESHTKRLADLETRLDTLETAFESRTDELSTRVDDLRVRLEREAVLLRSELSSEIEDVDDDLEDLETRVAAGFDAVTSALESDLETIRSATDGDLEGLESDVDGIEERLNRLEDDIETSRKWRESLQEHFSSE